MKNGFTLTWRDEVGKQNTSTELLSIRAALMCMELDLMLAWQAYNAQQNDDKLLPWSLTGK
jgi:accessory colonization factor AcfC